MDLLRSTAVCAACLIWPLAATANPITTSYTGLLADPNDVALIEFSVATAGTVNMQSWGYGGGTNGAGAVIVPGGFDSYFSLFAGTGSGATFMASNDDGGCPPGNADPSTTLCLDSSLSLLLGVGAYTLAVTLPSNFSFAENDPGLYSTLGDGFIGLAGDFSDYLGNARTSSWAVDITTGAGGGNIPEPGSLTLVLAALVALGVLENARRRTGFLALAA
jgi:hypothetical protein